MKLICVMAGCYYNGRNGIIEGKIYECLSDFNDKGEICRIQDNDKIFWAYKTCFKPLSLHREQRIDEILGIIISGCYFL